MRPSKGTHETHHPEPHTSVGRRPEFKQGRRRALMEINCLTSSWRRGRCDIEPALLPAGLHT